MDIGKSLAILFLSMLIISRALIFIFPKSSKYLMNKILKWSDKNFLIFGGFLFIASIAIFYYLSSIIILSQIISVAFALALLLGAFFLTHPDFCRAMMSLLVKKDDNWIRKHAGLAVIVALILLFYILKV